MVRGSPPVVRVEAVTGLSRRRRQVPGRPPIAFRYVTLCRAGFSASARLIGLAIDAASSRSRVCGWRPRGQQRSARLWICGQREERCPHIHRRSSSRRAQIPWALKAVTVRPRLAANAAAVAPGLEGPHRAKSRQMTRFHRDVPRQGMPRHGTRTKRTLHELRKPDTLTS